MSPTKRPSAIPAGLRKGLASTVESDPENLTVDTGSNGQLPRPEKPARVTLNLPPQLYRDLARWAGDAAVEMGVPRLGVQKALRAMVRVVLADKGIGAVVIGQARRDSED